MTREKQLNKAAFDYVNQGGTTAEWSDGWEDFSDAEYVEEAFKAGAEWEHKKLVEKACGWLELHVNDDKYYSCIGEETLVPYLIEDFLKAMEE